MIRLTLSIFASLLVALLAGCGEEDVQGKPAVGHGVEAQKKASPISNQLPAPKPLKVPTEND